MAERARFSETGGPPHDSFLHVHEHPGREPSATPHEHSHGGPAQEWAHQHLHRHLSDLPALEPLEDDPDVD